MKLQASDCKSSENTLHLLGSCIYTGGLPDLISFSAGRISTDKLG